jgi:hypothetical protein
VEVFDDSKSELVIFFFFGLKNPKTLVNLREILSNIHKSLKADYDMGDSDEDENEAPVTPEGGIGRNTAGRNPNSSGAARR